MAFVYRGEKVDLGFGRGWLDRAPANSIKRIDAAIGHPLQITEAGRTWAQQNVHYQNYLRNGWPIALNPNTPSEHQKGKSIDSDEAQRFVAFMAEHGWIRTVYRWVNGIWTLVEQWHFEYFLDRDKHRYEGVPGTTPTPTPTPTEEVIIMATEVIVTNKNNSGKAVADKDRRVAFVNTDSGFSVIFSWLTLADADTWAKQVGMPSALRFTDAGFDKFIGALK